MSSAEHLIENLIFGMKDGKDPNEIILYHWNQRNLDDCDMSAEEAIMIACHVVYGLYDGIFPSEDVQPVVRCKDCKHFHLDYWGTVNDANIIVAHEICDLWAGGCRTTQDTFCSNGVRKDVE